MRTYPNVDFLFALHAFNMRSGGDFLASLFVGSPVLRLVVGIAVIDEATSCATLEFVERATDGTRVDGSALLGTQHDAPHELVDMFWRALLGAQHPGARYHLTIQSNLLEDVIYIRESGLQVFELQLLDLGNLGIRFVDNRLALAAYFFRAAVIAWVVIGNHSFDAVSELGLLVRDRFHIQFDLFHGFRHADECSFNT